MVRGLWHLWTNFAVDHRGLPASGDALKLGRWRGGRPARRAGETKISQGLGVEEELVAPGAQQVLLAELRQCQADRLARHADGLRELVVRDAQDDAVLARLRRRAAAELQQRADQPAVAILEHEPRCVVARR